MQRFITAFSLVNKAAMNRRTPNEDTIGPEDVTLPKVLALPFGKQRPSWQFPGNGEPAPHPSVGSPDHLLP